MTNRYVRLLTLLLQDAAIANFEYWAEFIIRLQRDNAEHHPALAEWFGERRVPLECPVFFVPVVMIETGLKRSGDGTREEAHT
jgi:hypothetical protein